MCENSSTSTQQSGILEVHPSYSLWPCVTPNHRWQSTVDSMPSLTPWGSNVLRHDLLLFSTCWFRGRSSAFWAGAINTTSKSPKTHAIIQSFVLIIRIEHRAYRSLTKARYLTLGCSGWVRDSLFINATSVH